MLRTKFISSQGSHSIPSYCPLRAHSRRRALGPEFCICPFAFALAHCHSILPPPAAPDAPLSDRRSSHCSNPTGAFAKIFAAACGEHMQPDSDTLFVMTAHRANDSCGKDEYHICFPIRAIENQLLGMNPSIASTIGPKGIAQACCDIAKNINRPELGRIDATAVYSSELGLHSDISTSRSIPLPSDIESFCAQISQSVSEALGSDAAVFGPFPYKGWKSKGYQDDILSLCLSLWENKFLAGETSQPTAPKKPALHI